MLYRSGLLGDEPLGKEGSRVGCMFWRKLNEYSMHIATTDQFVTRECTGECRSLDNPLI
jgi:hypothetical protein